MKPAKSNKQIKEWSNKFSFLEEELQYFFMKMKRIKNEATQIDESASIDFLSAKIKDLLLDINKQKILMANTEKQFVGSYAEMSLFINRYEDIKTDFKLLLNKHVIFEAA